MGVAISDCHTTTDAESRGICTNPAQYESYGSIRTNCSEDSYVNDATSAPSSSSAVSPDSSSIMSNGGNATSGITDDDVMGLSAGATAGSTVSRLRTKLTNGTKIKVKGNGQVTAKDAAGVKMEQQLTHSAGDFAPFVY